MKFKSNIEVQAGIEDKDGQVGSNGQILASTGSQVDWIDPANIVTSATDVIIECKNTSGVTIAKGTPVYQTGNVGATAVIEVAVADASDEDKMAAIGLLQSDLINNAFGYVVVTGELLNITTSPIDGSTPTVGDTIYVKPGGGLTLTKPTGVNFIQNVGLVGKVSGGNAGSLTVSSIMRSNDVPTPLYIDHDNQRLGVGETSPDVKLHVAGDDTAAAFSTVLKVESTADEGSLQDIHIYNQYDRDIGIKFETLGGENYIWQDSNSDDALIISTGGSSRANDAALILEQDQDVIVPNGRLGIGTTSPGASLEVASTTDDYVAKFSHSTATGYAPGSILLQAGQGNSRGQGLFHYNTEADENWFTGVPYNVQSKKWIVANKYSTTQDVDTAQLTHALLTIDSDTGNVGIGTPSPSHLLTLETASSPGLKIKDTTQGATLLAFSQDSNSHIGTYSSHPLVFDTNSSERMRINSSGEVLVGITSNQTESKLTSRQNGSSIEFGHLNQSSGYYGTLGAMYSSGRPFLAFSCDNSPTSAGNNFATRGFKGNVIFSETNGNLKFAQATNANSTSQALTDRMAIKNDGAVQFNAYDSTNNTGTPTYLLGTDSSGNIVKTLPQGSGTAGPYLPLAGGTMTGNLKLNDNVQLQVGSSADLQILHASNSFLTNNTGDLYLRNLADDKDIIFQSDDGAGGVATYFYLDGSLGLNRFLKDTLHNDNVVAKFGTGSDLRIQHSSGNNSSYIQNYTGDLVIENLADDKDIIFKSDDGSGGTTPYLTLDSSITKMIASKDIHFDGTVKATFGSNATPASIYYNGNEDVDTGTETVASVVIATHTAAFFDFVIKKTTNVRSGTVYACHDGTSVEFTETSTQDLGDTSDVTLSVDISGGNMRLLATVTSDDWSVKSLIRAI